MTEEERECILMWDEMSIKTWLQYDPKRDLIEGFADLGIFGGSPRRGNHVLVFLLRGRQFDWRQPICYYVSHNAVDGKMLGKIILDVIKYVEKADFVLKSMNEARQQNHKEVIEEDRRNKLPANWEARKRRAEWITNDEQAKKNAEEKGLDYERVKLLSIDAISAEKMLKKKKRIDPNDGFADFEQATVRQYKSLVKSIKPNMEAYEEAKNTLGSAFYGDKNTILHGLHRDKKEAVDKMVADLDKQYLF
ncbi:pre-mRNA-splicing factor Syf2 [Copidosoma floridanum]|uniref:pre-mRNA-splicing factor Syf2 n=1 Tax=Copidosoma floridanum TaxID=29053 RepID=UPI000C6FA619|nr:pre-mRNA-splicing factor Syf2 [Copidosoma floridanum]